MKPKYKVSCWQIFSATLVLSAFTFGGGYVIISMMKKAFVDQRGWLEEDELVELIALGQSSPGGVAINACVLLGYRLRGLPGALCALVGTILPSLIILSVVYVFYDFFRDNPYVASTFKGMQAGITAVIADVVVDMTAPYLKKEKAVQLAIAVAAFILAMVTDLNVAWIILGAAVLGGGLTLVRKWRGGRGA